MRYSDFTGKPIAECYHKAYTELRLRYGFDVFGRSTRKGSSKLDEVEAAGQMKQLKSIVNWMINELSKNTYGEVTIEDILYNFF